MALQVTNTLTAIITSTEDSTGNVFVNRGNGNPAVDSTTGLYIQQFKTAGANVDTNLPFPNLVLSGEVDQLYIKNNDAVAIVTVKWIPAGGVLAVVVALQPGAMIMLWETVTGKGVNTITVASSIGGTFCEVFMGVI